MKAFPKLALTFGPGYEARHLGLRRMLPASVGHPEGIQHALPRIPTLPFLLLEIESGLLTCHLPSEHTHRKSPLHLEEGLKGGSASQEPIPLRAPLSRAGSALHHPLPENEVPHQVKRDMEHFLMSSQRQPLPPLAPNPTFPHHIQDPSPRPLRFPDFGEEEKEGT